MSQLCEMEGVPGDKVRVVLVLCAVYEMGTGKVRLIE